MGLIITMITLTIISFISILGAIISHNSEWTEEHKVSKKWSLLGFLWIIFIVFGFFTNIPVNNVGIMFNPFNGGLQSEVLNEGFKTKSPFVKVYKINTEVQEYTFNDLSVQTSDSQYVVAQMQLQVRVDKNQAFEFFKKYGGKNLKDIQSIVSNTTQQKLEQVTTKYNIMEMLGEKRNNIINETLSLIKEELLKDGILVERVVLIDTDAGEAIEQSIANEAVAKKNAEAAEYNKQKAQLEGEAKVIEAQKQQEANNALQESLSKEILTQKFIEKWNGVLPTTTLGEDIISMFNLNK